MSDRLKSKMAVITCGGAGIGRAFMTGQTLAVDGGMIRH